MFAEEGLALWISRRSPGVSFIVDAIFGSGKPSYVDLSEDSLREIQNRVREEIIRDAEFELLSQFQSLEDLLEAYHAHVNFTGVPNLTMQLDLLGRYKDAINHRALNPDNNSDFFYLADTFALLAAVSVAVQTERSLANQIPESEISNTANGLADTLDYMLSQKRATDLPLREDCEMVSSPTDQYREDYCWVEDANGYIIASSYVHDDPWSDDRWDRKRFGAVQDYMEENFYRLEDVVATLRSM